MAAWLNRSKQVLGVSRLLQNAKLVAFEPTALTVPRSTAQAGFATLPNKSSKTRTSPKAPEESASHKPSGDSVEPDVESNGKPVHKRSKSGYPLFLADQFKLLKSNTSDKLKATVASKEIGAKWKALSEAEKKPYLDTAAADKSLQQGNKQAKAKVGPRAKRLNGYNFFIKENFESVKARNPAISGRDVIVNMAHEWTAKDDFEKDKWKYRARASWPVEH